MGHLLLNEANTITTAITALTGQLGASQLWGVFQECVPMFASVTLVAVGFYLIRRQVKKMSKFKGGI